MASNGSDSVANNQENQAVCLGAFQYFEAKVKELERQNKSLEKQNAGLKMRVKRLTLAVKVTMAELYNLRKGEPITQNYVNELMKDIEE